MSNYINGLLVITVIVVTVTTTNLSNSSLGKAHYNNFEFKNKLTETLAQSSTTISNKISTYGVFNIKFLVV